ncbi:MAG: hypothetical protein ACRD21_08760 [Vicinamibacteria bacterium]
MRFGPVPLEEAEGRVLGHNVAGAEGKRLLRKGRALSLKDVERLRSLGRRTIYVAELEPGDVEENRAAERVARAALGPGLRLSGASSGRINLIATALGIFRIGAQRLDALNAGEGITIASLANHAVVRPGQTVATVKVIPYAVPEKEVALGESIAAERGPLLRVDALERRRAGLVLSGSPSVRDQLSESFTPLVERVTALGEEETLASLRSVGTAAASLDDWIDLHDYLLQIARKFRGGLDSLQMFARDIVQPFEAEPLAPFIEWYRDARARAVGSAAFSTTTPSTTGWFVRFICATSTRRSWATSMRRTPS